MYKRLRIYYLYTALPFIILLLGAATFSKAIINTLEHNPHPQINYTIFAVTLFGGLLIIWGVHKVMHEAKILDTFTRELRNGKSSEELIALCNKFDVDITYVLRMIAVSVGRSISHQEQSAIEHELHSAQSRLEVRHALPQFLTSLLVGLGLLGTFIGLLSALDDIGRMVSSFGALDVNSADLFSVFREMVTRMQAPMSSMAIAFSASMFGLLGSIILGFMMVASRGCVRELHSLLGSEVSQYLNLALSKTGPVTLAKVVDTMSGILTNSIDRLARELEISFSQLGVSLAGLDHNIRSLVETSGGDALVGAQVTMQELLARLDDRLTEGNRMHQQALDQGRSAMEIQRSDLAEMFTLNSGLIGEFRAEMQRMTGQIAQTQEMVDRNSQQLVASLGQGLSVKLTDSPDALERIPDVLTKVSNAMTMSASRIELAVRDIAEKAMNGTGSMIVSSNGAQEPITLDNMSREMMDEQTDLLRRIEERLSESLRTNHKVLQTELEQMNRTRGEMARVFNEHGEAVALFRSELQRVGRQMGIAHALMERTSTGLLDLLNDRFTQLNSAAQIQGEQLIALNDHSNRLADDSGQNRRLLGELVDRAKSQENRALMTEVVGAIRQVASLQIDLGMKFEQMHMEEVEQARAALKQQLEALKALKQ